ncbi:deoxyribodipyrimidine photo-lyase-like isoform X1 [Helianthus annuus]|uniref:deoxyribodipyrimidine photo-lyase-like isoform X1 n=1 Tax=Helianthus annuus TaxID=4232 RepID=UPI000B9064C4|nr:deoxyribodipyrimidine photo-lyase-like isoform X1 [Helianthus annuus]
MSSTMAVPLGRIRVLKEGIRQPSSLSPKVGPVVYWMFRDQRLRDNWALIHAVDQANRLNVPVAVAFNLFDQFLGAKARQLGFMLRGLQQLNHEIEETLHIPFFLFQGEAVDTIPSFVKECGASLLVTDFSPLRQVRGWKEEITKRVSDSVSIHEVDAHNIVPLWMTSDKLEDYARTIRPKINNHLPEYLIEFPTIKPRTNIWGDSNRSIDWDKLIEHVTREGDEVPEVEWCKPGESVALEKLKDFSRTRLMNYAADRNIPTKHNATSGLSPYLHFGQLSAQRCALEARKFRKDYQQVRTLWCKKQKHKPYFANIIIWDSFLISFFFIIYLFGDEMKGVDKFLDELIVWRELADNFSYYEPHYDSFLGACDWGRATLMDHAFDKRERIYTLEHLEKAQTTDPLWNASQLEMVHHGKMHGYMRMYWAKKILEWTSSPQEAVEIAVYLNDKYHLDGRDPNGYAGIMWSICGVHDNGFQERPVYGKIRSMTYAGCSRKFDVDGYIAYVKKLVRDVKKGKGEILANSLARLKNS